MVGRLQCHSTGSPTRRPSSVAALPRLTAISTSPLALAYQNAAPGANQGKKLARRPDQQANLTVDRDWGNKLSTGLSVRYVGASYDNAANTYRMSPYTLVDLRAAYAVTESVEIHGRIENLLDDHYETTRNYGSIGRGAFIGVRANF